MHTLPSTVLVPEYLLGKWAIQYHRADLLLSLEAYASISLQEYHLFLPKIILIHLVIVLHEVVSISRHVIH